MNVLSAVFTLVVSYAGVLTDLAIKVAVGTVVVIQVANFLMAHS